MRHWIWPLFVLSCETATGTGASPTPPAAAQGSEQGACYDDGTCNEGLTCASNLCVMVGGQGGTGGQGNAGGVAGSTSGVGGVGAGGAGAGGLGGGADCAVVPCQKGAKAKCLCSGCDKNGTSFCKDDGTFDDCSCPVECDPKGAVPILCSPPTAGGGGGTGGSVGGGAGGMVGGTGGAGQAGGGAKPAECGGIFCGPYTTPNGSKTADCGGCVTGLSCVPYSDNVNTYCCKSDTSCPADFCGKTKDNCGVPLDCSKKCGQSQECIGDKCCDSIVDPPDACGDWESNCGTKQQFGLCPQKQECFQASYPGMKKSSICKDNCIIGSAEICKDVASYKIAHVCAKESSYLPTLGTCIFEGCNVLGQSGCVYCCTSSSF